MEQLNTNMSVAGNSTDGFALSQPVGQFILSEGCLTMRLPLRFAGGNLGLSVGGKIFVDIEDAQYNRYITESVEWILRNIDHFTPERTQVQLLAGAAVHYGLDPYALMGRDIDATKQLHREGKLG